MIESRRWPKATPVFWSTHTPSASGPRWLRQVAMRRAISVSCSLDLLREVSRKPVMPHIDFSAFGLRVCGASDFFVGDQIRVHLLDGLVQNVFAFVAQMRDREIFEDALASAEIQCIAGVEPVQQSCGKSLCVVGRNDDSSVADDQRRIAYVGDDAVTAAGHRFTDDIRESFADRRRAKDIDGIVNGAYIGLRLNPVNLAFESKRAGELLQFLQVRLFAVADANETDVWAFRGD